MSKEKMKRKVIPLVLILLTMACAPFIDATPSPEEIAPSQLEVDTTESHLVTGNITIDAMPLSALLPENFPVAGFASGQAILQGNLANPQLELKLHVYDLIIKDPSLADIPPATGELSLSFKDGILICSGTILTPYHPLITFNAQLAAAFSLMPFTFQFDKLAPIHGKISSSGEISPIIQLLSDAKILLFGEAKAELKLEGTLDSPQISGSCDINNGLYEIPEIGVVLTNLTAHIIGTGSSLQVESISANDSKNGTVTGTGSIILDEKQKFPFTLNLMLNHAIALNQDYLQAICSGPLSFKGDTGAGKIEGELHLDEGKISIPDHSSAVINSVEVTYINVQENAPLPQSLSFKHSDWPLTMDIHLHIPDNLPITGRDLTSVWKGNINISGLTETPQLQGQLKVISGEYLFNGNPFNIKQGTIDFAGDIDKKTTLYVIANKDLDKVKVDVIAKGPVNNPTISFRSNPPLPQREILSWILFNSGTSEISPFQGAQLSESITNLKTGQSGPDVLSKIRSTLGVDRFEISRNCNNDDNSVNVQVGKYIYDGVLVSVIKSDVNRLAIEAAITDRIKLQAQVGDDSQGQLFLKWKRNY